MGVYPHINFVLLHEDFNSETVLAINHHNCYGDGPLFDVTRTCDVIQI